MRANTGVGSLRRPRGYTAAMFAAAHFKPTEVRAFLSELRRRNVVKVATVYVVVGWGVIQAADVLFPALTLPKWTVTLVVALVIAGFPISLMLAWAFELTPSGIGRDNKKAVSTDTPIDRRIETAPVP